MGEHMTIYIKLDGHHVAVLSYCNMNDDPKYRMITNLEVPIPYRRRGTAHKLLKNLCDLADTEYFTLFMYVIPSRTMTRNDIIKLMTKYKFVLINKQTMCRCTLPDISKEWLCKVVEAYEMEE